MSIRLKQILGVTALVGAVVVALSVANLARIARLSLEESRARGELLTNAVFHRAYEVVTSRDAAYAELAADAGIRSILQASIYSDDVTYAAIVDASGVAVAHSDPAQVGQRLAPGGGLPELLALNGFSQLMEIWSTRGRTLEWQRAAAARRRGPGRDPHRHLDAAGPPLARGDRDAGAGRGPRRCCWWPCSSPSSSPRPCCGRST